MATIPNLKKKKYRHTGRLNMKAAVGCKFSLVQLHSHCNIQELCCQTYR